MQLRSRVVGLAILLVSMAFGSAPAVVAGDPQPEPAESRAGSGPRGSGPIDFDGIAVDTRGVGRSPEIPAGFASARSGLPQFWLVQFAGPIRAAWYAALMRTGVDVVTYIAPNAYVVWGDAETLARLDGLAATAAEVQWSGPFHPWYRLSPGLRSRLLGPGSDAVAVVDVMVQLVKTAATPASLAVLTSKSAAPSEGALFGPLSLGKFTAIALRVSERDVADIARRPDVFSVREWAAPRLRDESQGQILASQLISQDGRIVPVGPGYLAFLQAHGFSAPPQAFPIVAVMDDGVDNGATEGVLHPDFHEFGDSALPSRVAFSINCTFDGAANGADGHGTLNAGIVAGYNDRSGFPYRDALGYRLGLGVSPFGRIGNTKLFANGGYFDTSRCNDALDEITASAYGAGARITSNSWGADAGGVYDVFAQAYDILTRDADAWEADGNQELLHIFAAGNAGPGSQTVGSPATAKNVIAVGALQGVREDGVLDGCSVRDAGDADAPADFSSRGPAADGRAKPDLAAPGTHVQGPASQDPTYNGSGVCGAAGRGRYYPPGQALYTWSSGTSHSTPAVAGAAALVAEYYGRVIEPGATASPAMLKALLLNTPRAIPAATLPSAGWGWGGVDLAAAFDGAARRTIDQSVLFTESGQEYALSANVGNVARPLHITLVWTDAPGPTLGSAGVNDLDLEVMAGGRVYRGNVFSGTQSVEGGSFDRRNNVESVFLGPGVSGPFQVRVMAHNIAGDGVPGNASPLDQDFALVIYNVESAIVRGRVTNTADGSPIAGAQIEMRAWPTQTVHIVSDLNGAYERPLPPGDYTARAQAYGYFPSPTAQVTVQPSGALTLDFALMHAPEVHISGHLTDATTGFGVAGDVAVRGAPFNPPTLHAETDDASGAFSLTVAAGQAYTLTANSRLHAAQTRALGAITADRVEGFSMVPLTVTGGIYGRLSSDIDGAPVANAALDVNGAPVKSAADGAFSVLGLWPGMHRLGITQPYYDEVTRTVAVSQSHLTRVDISLSSSRLALSPVALARALSHGDAVGEVDGLVISNTGTRPLTFALESNVEWLATTPIAGTVLPGAAASIDLAWDGRSVEQPAILSGTLLVRNNDPLAQRSRIPLSMTVAPSAGEGALAGQVGSLGVCDAHPHPLGGAKISINSAAGFSRTVAADAHGGFRYYLDEGSYTATAGGSGHLGEARAIGIVRGAETRADFALRLDAACPRLHPQAIPLTLGMGQAISLPLDVINTGTRAMSVSLFTTDDGQDGPVHLPPADAFGYTYKTSLEAGGPHYAWLDLADGERLGLRDDGMANVTLPFVFPFYGDSVDAIRVSNNGALLLDAGGGALDWVNQPLTTTTAPNLIIAPFWDDLGDDVGEVRYKVVGEAPRRAMVVAWLNRPHFDDEGLASFQVVLHEDGSILFQYRDTDFGVPAWDFGASATVGIRGLDAANSVPYSHMAPAVPSGLAICLRRPGASECGAPAAPWLRADSPPGIVAGTATFTATADAGRVAQPGTYRARFNVRTDSPLSVIDVPITLTVPVPEGFGRVRGEVSGLDACGGRAAPLPAALRSDAWPFTLTAGAQGEFDVWLPAGPQMLIASADDHASAEVPIAVSAGTQLTLSVALPPRLPCAQMLPADGLSALLMSGRSVTRQLEIRNTGASTLTWALMTAPPAAPASPIELVRDGGFEGTPLTFESAEWWAESLRFGTPLCTTLPPFYCGVSSGTAGPRSGTWFAWFFGSAHGDFGAITQSMFISHGQAFLTYHAWVGLPGRPEDYVRAVIDDAAVSAISVTQATTGYVPMLADVSRFADDLTHTLRFEYSVSSRARVSLDDIALTLAEPFDCRAGALEWLETAPHDGAIAPGEAATIEVRFTAPDAIGPYSGALCLITNDRTRSRIYAPVALNVVPHYAVNLPLVARR